MKKFEFVDNAVYTIGEVGEILGRTNVTVLKLLKRGVVKGRRDGKGWLVPGWGLREYLNVRVIVK